MQPFRSGGYSGSHCHCHCYCFLSLYEEANFQEVSKYYSALRDCDFNVCIHRFTVQSKTAKDNASKLCSLSKMAQEEGTEMEYN